MPLSFSGGVLDGGVLELALDDLSAPEALEDAPADGLGLDGLDDAIEDDDDGDDGDVLDGLLDGVLDAVLEELGGVVEEVDVLWRSLQATDSSAAAIATDSTEAFICFSFR